MESLVGPNGIEQLSELECALSILAAYTHDLGMTLTPEERANISTDADYVRHRDRFTEETKLIERLLSQQDHHRAALIENHIITDYIRATHAGQPGKRMADRLREIAPRLEFGGVDLTFRLQLQDKSGTPFQPVDGIHARPGFFKHHGPEQELAVTLSWGEQDGIQFLRVDDNGAGMTLQTIERNQRSVA
jgi:hypothetical protein